MIIALSTCAAFAAGSAVGWIARRFPRMRRPVRILALLIAAALAVFFFQSNASRYALLLPLAFAAGVLLAEGDSPTMIFRRD